MLLLVLVQAPYIFGLATLARAVAAIAARVLVSRSGTVDSLTIDLRLGG